MKRKYNLTTNFALPLLGWRRSMFEPYLVDAYMSHEGVEYFKKGHLFVLLEESLSDQYKKIEDILMNHKSHVGQYHVDQGEQYSMHVFKVSKGLMSDLNLYSEGKYSRMSEKAKKLIRTSSTYEGVNYKILKRDVSLAKMQEEKIGLELPEGAEVWPSIKDAICGRKEVFTDATLVEQGLL